MSRENNTPESLYIDAASFAQERVSGIGHVAGSISEALLRKLSLEQPQRKLYLVVSLGKAKYLQEYKKQGAHIRTIPIPARVLNLLLKLDLPISLDRFLGKGIYVFPNYRNWRLSASRAYTYIHDVSFHNFPEYTEPRNLKFLQSNIKLWAERSAKVITSSAYTKKEIADVVQISDSNIEIVPHGVDKSVYYRRDSDECARVLAEYGVEGEYILCVGNIEPRKNITGLIAAYRTLPTDIRNKYGLLLIGGGGWLNDAEREAIRVALSDGYNILRPTQYVKDEDLPFFYSAARVLVMASHYEGFGIPPLQAMAVGTPTVVANNSSLRELFSGVSILVDSHDSASIAGGLIRSLTMDAQELKDYRHKASAKSDTMNWESAANRLMEVIDAS